MQIWLVVLTFSTGCALVGAVWALVSSHAALKQLQHLDRSFAKQSDLRKLDADLDDVFDRMKRLQSRKAMRTRRENEQEAADTTAQLPGESPEDWKKRVREGLRSGKIKLSH